MPKPNNEEQQNQSQVYDVSLKELVDRQARDILPALLPGVEYEKTCNVEMIRPALSADKVYIVKYRGKRHVLHLEFQTGTGKKMAARMLIYNAILYMEYGLPVISIIIYPFRTPMIKSPLHVESGDETIITFHFRILPLFTLDAEYYVRKHITSMYALLPTMQGVNHTLLKLAMGELVVRYCEDQKTLADIFAYMTVLLDRTDTVSSTEKKKIKEALSMYDNLLNESQLIQKIRAESEATGEARGEAKGITKGELRATQRMLVNIVNIRFPGLAGLAHQKASQISDAGTLERLIQQVVATSDEKTVRWILDSAATK